MSASRRLADLKGVAASVPNPDVLVSTMGLREAKDSSEIEHIVTSDDELFREAATHGLDGDAASSAAAREVTLCRHALRIGLEAVHATGLLTARHIVAIQAALEQGRSGYRRLPGPERQDDTGRNSPMPPVPEQLPGLMADLESFINDPARFDADPLVKMALIHQQFESIHPFPDGNGRTGRAVSLLYLVKEGLLDIPVLYLSGALLRTQRDHDRLLQGVHANDDWEAWVVYMLDAVEQAALESITTIQAIKALLLDYKLRIRAEHRFYSRELINNLFTYPYTRIEFIQHDLKVSRLTATRYLDVLAAGGFVRKRKTGRSNYYINEPLFRILTGSEAPTGDT